MKHTSVTESYRILQNLTEKVNIVPAQYIPYKHVLLTPSHSVSLKCIFQSLRDCIGVKVYGQ